MKINEIDRSRWNGLTAKSPYGGPFHDFGWAGLITEVLGGEFHPLIVTDDSQTWLVPCYTNRPWSGPEEVKIGSVGYGGPLPVHTVIDPADEMRKIHDILKLLAKHFDVKNINATLYPAKMWDDLPEKKSDEMNLGLTCRVLLSKTPEKLFDHVVTGNVRTAIRKSEKSGVRVREIDPTDETEMHQAHQLLCETQRNVGAAYETPYELFYALAVRGRPGTGTFSKTGTRVFVAVHEGRIVAVGSLVFDKHEAFHQFHGWDRSASSSCANQALLWYMMKFAIQASSSTFNMGESHSEALLQAKLRWGGRLERIPRLRVENLPGPG